MDRPIPLEPPIIELYFSLFIESQNLYNTKFYKNLVFIWTKHSKNKIKRDLIKKVLYLKMLLKHYLKSINSSSLKNF